MSTRSDNTIYVVTGASSGIGLGLALDLLSRPKTTVIATVRDPSSAAPLEVAAAAGASSHPLEVVGKGSELLIAHLDFSPPNPPTPETILSRIQQAASSSSSSSSSPSTPLIPHIDVLICNAGWPAPLVSALSTTQDDLRASFEINTIAPLSMFQALYPSLIMKQHRRLRPNPPKVIMITSSVGSISALEGPGGGYGPSKAALNWLTKALHVQHADDGLVAVAVHPGWVQTRAGRSAARDWGFVEVPAGENEIGPRETVEGCVEGLLGIVDGATRENWGGKFVTYKGEELPW